MAPGSDVQVAISTNGDEEGKHLRTFTILLRRNLETAGLRPSPQPECKMQSDDDLEEKGAVSLYTLGLSFITSGAAVALINAVRATFAAAHSTHLRVQIQLPQKTVEISGDNLSDSRSEQLLAVLTKELPL